MTFKHDGQAQLWIAAYMNWPKDPTSDPKEIAQKAADFADLTCAAVEEREALIKKAVMGIAHG